MRRSWRRVVTLLAGLATLTGASVAFYARRIHPFRPKVEEIEVQLPPRAARLDGVRIAFVTDTHVGPHFPAEALEPAIALVEAAAPDLVLFGGDYISESPRYLARSVAQLDRMAAAARYGAFAVLGNHDVANVLSRVEDAFAASTIRLLRNEAVRVDLPGGVLWIAGVDEGLLGDPDVARTFAAIPAGEPALALWHEPDYAEAVAPHGPLLLLAGHTHGGQVRLPGIGPLALPLAGHRYPAGRYTVRGMPLYVSRGVGIYRPPVRLNCPPEVTLIRLVSTCASRG